MLGERHGRGDFRLEDLRDRLGTAEWMDDMEFEAYGLSADDIHALSLFSFFRSRTVSRTGSLT
jgi:hypothetical protein